MLPANANNKAHAASAQKRSSSALRMQAYLVDQVMTLVWSSHFTAEHTQMLPRARIGQESDLTGE